MTDPGTRFDLVDPGPSGPRLVARRLALAVAAVLGLSGVFGVSPQAVAAASSQAPATPGNTSTTPEQSTDEVVDYWTAERMAAARPAGAGVATAPSAAGAAGDSEPAGDAVVVPGATGSLGAATTDVDGSGGGTATQVPKPYTDLPDRLNGKVFFTKRNGGNFVCSGTLVNNPRKNLVLTAGHCVHGGRGGTWHINWTFVPAYDGTAAVDSREPYGSWTAWQLHTRDEWANKSNLRQDIGVAILNDGDDGQTLGARIGGQGISFNLSDQQTWTDFGYPASSPFNGLIQWQCVSDLRGRDTAIGGVGPAPLRIQCDMTGGSSGGGWLIGIGTNGLGSLNSVNSYGYPTLDPGFIYGPYFGNEAKSLYDATKDLGPSSK